MKTTVTGISHTTRRASRAEGQNQIVTKPYSMEHFSINTRRLHRTSSTSPTQLSTPTMMLGVHRILPHIPRQITTIDLEEGWREGRRALCVHRAVITHLPRCQSRVTRRGVTNTVFRLTSQKASSPALPGALGSVAAVVTSLRLDAVPRNSRHPVASLLFPRHRQHFSASQHACPSAGVLANS